MSGAVEITGAQALSWRMRRHLLEPVGALPAHEVVRRLTAIPAASDVDLAVRTRQVGGRPGEVAEAVRDGRILRTFAFRGAVHLLTRENAGAYLALRASGRQWELPSWQEHYRLGTDDWPAFRAAVREALLDHPLTPGELGAALGVRREYEHLRPVFASAPWTLLKALAWQGDLVLGPSRSGTATLQHVDDTVRAAWPDLADAGRFAVESYVRAYGPTTPDHLQYWFGAGLSAGRRRIQGWVAELRDRLAPVVVDGAESFVLAADLDELVGTAPTTTVRLLPGHDQWVLGPGTADPGVVPPAHRAVVSRGANLVTAGGVVVGTWSLRDDDLEVSLFPSGTAPESAAFEEGVVRLAASLDQPLRPRVTTG